VEARSIYGRLIAQHPGSAEALAALVSLGELQLSQFGDAKAALKSFDAYVRAGGSLAQEARYGRIRALRKLGRHAEEQAAIDRFLADYPHSVQAATLRARLSESFSARRP
jgi:outer membrane protein assembly factor BamD (BamD/ComL family)